MLELKQLSKRYLSGTKALEDVSLTLPRGEIVGLFGENGAGKTTLMKCVLGFLKYSGDITYREHFGAFREKRFQGLMDFFQLPMNRAVRGFSTGQKNQFEVILALSQGADYILMDEPFAGNDLFNREDFYKVLLGILEPEETILISTHLIEEVQHFISRAVLLHKGKLAGDSTTLALEEAGKSVMDFVKETCQYQPDRVVQALSDLTDKEE